ALDAPRPRRLTRTTRRYPGGRAYVTLTPCRPHPGGWRPAARPDPRSSGLVPRPRRPHACCPHDGRFPPQPCPLPRLVSVRRDGHPRQPIRVARCRTRFPPPTPGTRIGSAGPSSAAASTVTCTPHQSRTGAAAPTEPPVFAEDRIGNQRRSLARDRGALGTKYVNIRS